MAERQLSERDLARRLARATVNPGQDMQAVIQNWYVKIRGYLSEDTKGRTPSWQAAVELAHALRCSLDELVGIEDIRAGRIELPEEILNMAHKFDKLDKRDQDLMMALALRLAELQRKKDEKDK